MAVVLNLLAFVVGDILLFGGLFSNPPVMWMVWAGSGLLVITLGVFGYLWKKKPRRN